MVQGFPVNRSYTKAESDALYGGGEASVETPVGAVNGVNTVYTVSNTPKWLVVDGVQKFETLHYTYSSGTITMTDGAPPYSFIRSIYR